MAYQIISPRFSFVQFGETGVVAGCGVTPYIKCLPVYDDRDVSFQFVVQADTKDQADLLCDLENDKVVVGLASDCDGEFILDFLDAGYKPQRFRISDFQVLYNWTHGVPGFATVVSPGQCFIIKILVEEQEFCSNCFTRIIDDCYTAVVEYGNDENAFGFNYCNDEGDYSGGGSQECEPLVIPFNLLESITIPYTQQMKDLYGFVPTVQVWMYNESGELQNMGVSVTFDDYPPDNILIDFGGVGSGIIKIM